MNPKPHNNGSKKPQRPDDGSLKAFIEQHHKKIIEEWVTFARGLHPWSNGLSEKELEDHADELLTAVVADMESTQTGAETSIKSKGGAAAGALTSIGHKHASDRLESGFKLDQLVSEYRALRASVVRLWGEAHGDTRGELTRFNEAIDETLAQGAAQYSELLNHTREQFLAVLGHDLRNPLGAIIVGASLLTKLESLGDKEARAVTRILNSAERMGRMVGYLLDLARTRLGGTIPITPSRMDLAAVCKQVLAELRVIHPHRQLTFEARGDLSGDWDSDRLAQVVSNLAANALQYSASAVSVVGEGDRHEVLLRVHNDGAPIAAQALKTIFEPMVRQAGPDDANQNATGLGLGLFIAREILTSHGATVGVTSTANEGTTFTVKLPRRSRSKRHTDAPEEQPKDA